MNSTDAIEAFVGPLRDDYHVAAYEHHSRKFGVVVS